MRFLPEIIIATLIAMVVVALIDIGDATVQRRNAQEDCADKGGVIVMGADGRICIRKDAVI